MSDFFLDYKVNADSSELAQASKELDEIIKKEEKKKKLDEKEPKKPKPKKEPKEKKEPSAAEKASKDLDKLQRKAKQTGVVLLSNLSMRGGMGMSGLKSLASTMGGAGLAAGLFAHGLVESSQQMDRLGKKTSGLQVDLKQVDELGFVFDKFGSDSGIEEATAQLDKMNQLRTEMQRGGGMFTSALQEVAMRGDIDITQAFQSEDPLANLRSLNQMIRTAPQGTQQDIMNALGFTTAQRNLALAPKEAAQKEFDVASTTGVSRSDLTAEAEAAARLQDSLTDASRKLSTSRSGVSTFFTDLLAGMVRMGTSAPTKEALSGSKVYNISPTININQTDRDAIQKELQDQVDMAIENANR